MSEHDPYSAKRALSPLLRAEQVAQLLGCSIKHVRTLHKTGKLPPRTHISERIVGWREGEIEAWLLSQREEGDDV